MIPQSVEQRFWQHVPARPARACWIWRGAFFVAGYGSLGVAGKPRGAHRLSWEIHRGPVPAGQSVLHRCDVRACVNPDHLFLGTQADNMRDAAEKGRLHAPRTRKGVTPEDRLFIYSSRGAVSAEELARRYGVTLQAIWAIRRGRFLQRGFQPPARFHQPPLRRADGAHPAFQEGDPIRVRGSR